MSARNSISSQLIALSMAPAAIVASALALLYVTTRATDLDRDYSQIGDAAVAQLARTAEFAIATQNPEIIASTLQATLKKPHVLRSSIQRLDESVVSTASLAAQDDFAERLAAARIFRASIHDASRGTIGAIASPPVVGTARIEMDVLPLREAKVRLYAATAAALAFLLAVLAFSVAVWARRVSRPLTRLSDVVRKLALGDLAARAEPTGRGEVRTLEVGVNVLARAVSDSQRQLSEKVEAATSALKSQRDAAAAASQAKSRFLAATSHDLRQPMHALGLFCSALERRIQDPEQRSLLGNIQSSLGAMEGLFESLLDLSRLETGRVVANIDRIPLQAIFEAIDLEYRAAARDKGLRFRVRATEEWVLADATLLRRIVMNFVSNAIRYTREGGVLVAAQRRGDEVRVSVWDTGPGIDESSRAAIFEEFVQLSSDTEGKTKGLGLGLAIAKRSAELLGTQITLGSRANRGSRFSLALAGSMSRQLPRENTRKLQTTTIPDQWLGQRVLVIEDDEAGRLAMVELFSQWGCVVRSAESADAAALAVDESWIPHIIVSDFRLRAGETGLDAIAQVERKTHRTYPVVIVSGELGISIDVVSSGHPLWVFVRKPAAASVLRTAMLGALMAHRTELPATTPE